MTFSPVKTIGALVYRTREALSRDKRFMDGLDGYYYGANCRIGEKFNLWHYPGTPNEISGVLLELDKNLTTSSLKFPGIFNFQSVRQRVESTQVTVWFNLAIVAPVFSDWRTEEREKQAFETVLRPVYAEFIRQVQRSGFFLTPNTPPHDYYEVFTTGKNPGEIIERYGDHIDAIEVHNLSLTLKKLCPSQLKTIEGENELVTENILNLLKT